jgi:hypothetical protein
MASSSGGLIVTSRDASLLLRSMGKPQADIEKAVEVGLAVKQKVEGRWLYHAADVSIESVKSSLERESAQIVRSWFIVQMSWLPGMAAKQIRTITPDAADVLLRQLVRQQTFAGIGLLTQRDQPYLALYLPDDATAVNERVRTMEAVLTRKERITGRELPDPPRPTQNEGWRATLLRHGEFLGLGVYENWELTGWGAV